MQIAMAAAGSPFCRARRQQGCQARQTRLQRRFQRGNDRFWQACGTGGAQVTSQHRSHGGGRIQPRHRRHLMQGENRIAHGIQKLVVQATAGRHPIQEIARGYGRHAQHPFHHLTPAALLQISIGSAGDCHHIAVNAGGGGLVQFQFPPAEMPACFQAAEIQKAQRHRFFHFPGGLPPDKNRRNMGFNRRGAGKPGQKGGHLRLGGGNAARLCHG